MNNLYQVIERCKEGSEEHILYILNEFDPLINKYARCLEYDDTKQELILAFIETIHKIPIHKEIFKEDKYIISYIEKSIIYKYLAISKKQSKIKKYSYEYDFDFDLVADKREENSLELEDLLKVLTHREGNVIVSKYIHKMTDVEIGEINNISRQAVNQAKNRAIDKLREYII